MTYEQFLSALCDRLNDKLPPETSYRMQKIYKNNGLVMDAMIISNRQSNVSPTIFLNYYYEEDNPSPDFDAICQDIIRSYEQNCAHETVDVKFFTDFSAVKSRLAFRLINYEKNKELLETVPHIHYLDFAIVFYCLLNVTAVNNATILIHEQHLELWQTTAQELYQLTLETTPKLLPADCRNMSLVLGELIGREQADTDDNSTLCPMYLLTNQHKLYGASCLLYPGLLKQISEKLDSDLFILPSSIHELIVLPAENRGQADSLADMVSEINYSELSKDEVLSDHVYYYSRAEDALVICD